jgi:hypothetical protein
MKLPEKSPAQQLAEVLNKQCPEEEIGRVLQRCLTATSMSRAGVLEQDFKTQLATAIFVTSQRHGLPIRREEIIQMNVDADSSMGMKDRLAQSPALRALFRKILDETENDDAIEV